MRTTQITSIECEYGEQISENKIRELNEDFKKMGIPLSARDVSSEDLLILEFIKEEIG